MKNKTYRIRKVHMPDYKPEAQATIYYPQVKGWFWWKNIKNILNQTERFYLEREAQECIDSLIRYEESCALWDKKRAERRKADKEKERQYKLSKKNKVVTLVDYIPKP